MELCPSDHTIKTIPMDHNCRIKLLFADNKIRNSIVDTGASENFCTRSLAAKLVTHPDVDTFYYSQRLVIHTANGPMRLGMTKVITFPLTTVDRQITVTVSAIILKDDSLQTPLILGVPFMKSVGAEIAFRSNTPQPSPTSALTNKSSFYVPSEYYKTVTLFTNNSTPYVTKGKVVAKLPGIKFETEEVDITPYSHKLVLRIKSRTHQSLLIKADTLIATVYHRQNTLPEVKMLCHQEPNDELSICPSMGPGQWLSQLVNEETTADQNLVPQNDPSPSRERRNVYTQRKQAPKQYAPPINQAFPLQNRFGILEQEENPEDPTGENDQIYRKPEVESKKSSYTKKKTLQRKYQPEYPAKKEITTFAGQADPLSNFFPTKLKIYGRTFPSSEHAYQWRKAIICKDYGLADSILTAPTASQAKYIAQRLNNNKKLSDCLAGRIEIMKEIIIQKFQQESTYRQSLQKANPIIAETVRSADTFWTTGITPVATRQTPPQQWRGDNVMGILHMQIRNFYFGEPSTTQYKNYKDFLQTQASAIITGNGRKSTLPLLSSSPFPNIANLAYSPATPEPGRKATEPPKIKSDPQQSDKQIPTHCLAINRLKGAWVSQNKRYPWNSPTVLKTNTSFIRNGIGTDSTTPKQLDQPITRANLSQDKALEKSETSSRAAVNSIINHNTAVSRGEPTTTLHVQQSQQREAKAADLNSSAIKEQETDSAKLHSPEEMIYFKKKWKEKISRSAALHGIQCELQKQAKGEQLQSQGNSPFQFLCSRATSEDSHTTKDQETQTTIRLYDDFLCIPLSAEYKHTLTEKEKWYSEQTDLKMQSLDKETFFSFFPDLENIESPYKERLQDILDANRTVFCDPRSDEFYLKPNKLPPVELQFKKGSPARLSVPYPISYSPERAKIVAEKLRELEIMGVVKPCSDVAYFHNLVLVQRPDSNKFRLTVDARSSNAHLVHSTPNMPSITSLMNTLASSNIRYSVSLDGKSSYYTFKVAKHHQKYLGVINPVSQQGLVFTRLLMGSSNSPSSHVNAFANLFANLITKYSTKKTTIRDRDDFPKYGHHEEGNALILVYLDDIFIGAKTKETLLNVLSDALLLLKTFSITISPNKVGILKEQVTFLGFSYSFEQGTVSPPIKKIEQFRKIKFDNLNRKSLTSVLYGWSFFRQLCPSFAQLSGELFQLATAKDTPYRPTQRHKDLFAKLQHYMAERTLFDLPREEGQWVIFSDSSLLGLCSILTQLITVNGKQQYLPIRIFSKALTKSQRNWSILQLEISSVVLGLKCFEQLIENQEVTIMTDSLDIVHLFNRRREGAGVKQARIARALAILETFNCTVSHIKGTENHLTDLMSRIEYLTKQRDKKGEGMREKREPEENTENTCDIDKSLDEYLGDRSATAYFTEVKLQEEDDDTFPNPFIAESEIVTPRQLELYTLQLASIENVLPKEQIKRHTREKDELSKHLIEYLEEGDLPDEKPRLSREIVRIAHQYCIHDGVLYKIASDREGKEDYKLYIPATLVESYLHHLHNQLSHAGKSALAKACNVVYFPGMSRKIAAFVANCPACQTSKIIPRDRMVIKQPNYPSNIGETLHMDYLQYDEIMYRGQRRKFILLVQDAATNYLSLYLMKDMSAEELILTMLEHQASFGAPQFISHDAGSQLISEAMKFMCAALGIKQKVRATRNPLGAVEATVKIVKQKLLVMTQARPTIPWPQMIHGLQLAYNCSYQYRLQTSPFYLQFLRIPRLTFINSLPTEFQVKPQDVPSQKDILNHLITFQTYCLEFHKESRQEKQPEADVRRFLPGDLVWILIRTKHHPLRGGASNLSSPYYAGPFIVLQEKEENESQTYSVMRADTRQPINYKFKSNQLKRYVSQLRRPIIDETEDSNAVTVNEQILPETELAYRRNNLYPSVPNVIENLQRIKKYELDLALSNRQRQSIMQTYQPSLDPTKKVATLSHQYPSAQQAMGRPTSHYIKSALPERTTPAVLSLPSQQCVIKEIHTPKTQVEATINIPEPKAQPVETRPDQPQYIQAKVPQKITTRQSGQTSITQYEPTHGYSTRSKSRGIRQTYGHLKSATVNSPSLRDKLHSILSKSDPQTALQPDYENFFRIAFLLQLPPLIAYKEKDILNEVLHNADTAGQFDVHRDEKGHMYIKQAEDYEEERSSTDIELQEPPGVLKEALERRVEERKEFRTESIDFAPETQTDTNYFEKGDVSGEYLQTNIAQRENTYNEENADSSDTDYLSAEEDPDETKHMQAPGMPSLPHNWLRADAKDLEQDHKNSTAQPPIVAQPGNPQINPLHPPKAKRPKRNFVCGDEYI